MGFSQEVKDFISGYQATSEVGQKSRALELQKEKNAADMLNDEATLDLRRQQLSQAKAASDARLKLAYGAAGRAEAAAGRAGRALSIKEQAAVAAAGKAKDDKMRGYVDDGSTAEDDYTAAEGDAAEILGDEDPYIGIDAFADGGLVQTAAGGASVSALPMQTTIPANDWILKRQKREEAAVATPVETPAKTPVEPTEAIPVTAPPVPLPRNARPKVAAPTAMGAKKPIASGAEIEKTLTQAGIVAEAAMKKLTDDVNSAKVTGSTEAIDTTGPARNRKAADSAEEPVVAATEEEMKAILAKVDPTKSLDPYMEGAKTMVEVYNYFMERGDSKMAAKASAKIVAYNKDVSMMLGDQAITALKQGDTATAAQLITGAYNTIPDGQTIETNVMPDGSIGFKVMLGDKLVHEGLANPEQLWQMAGQVADGSAFIDQMARLADRHSPKKLRAKFGDATNNFIQTNAEYRTLKEQYDAADGTTQKKMNAQLRELEAARKEAYAKVHELGSPLYKDRKGVDDAIKSAISSYGEATTAAPAVAAEGTSQWDTLVNSYQRYESQIGQLATQLEEMASTPDSPEYKAVLDRMGLLATARDGVRAEIDKFAPSAMPNMTAADRRKAVDERLTAVGESAPTALPIGDANQPAAWGTQFSTNPVTQADFAKEAKLLERIRNGEKLVFAIPDELSIERATDSVMSNKIDADLLVGKMVRDGINPRQLVQALKERGVQVTVDIEGVPAIDSEEK